MPDARRAIAGILNVDKPYGITSMDVVRRVKRGTGIRKVGHGGTLDPVATGVIPICLGRATRMMEYLISGTKEYRAVVELGVSTDTYDALGTVTARAEPAGLTDGEIDRRLEPFRGVTQQVPPMYSALKQKGKRLYDLARAGIHVEREPRSVETYRVDLVDWSPPLATIEVGCGRGFYMRSLAHDLGQAIGCGGHLKQLIRLRSGPFHLSGTTSLEALEKTFEEDTWTDLVYAPDLAVQRLPSVILNRRTEEMIGHGRPIPPGVGLPPPPNGEPCRAYTVDGRFIGLLAFDDENRLWRAQRLFST